MRFTLDKWFEKTFFSLFDNWVKKVKKLILGINIRRIKFKLLDRSYLFSAKWNLKDLIIFKPHWCSQSVVICVHGASFREQWNILLLLHRRNFRVFCLIIAVLKPTFSCVWKKARYFAEERKPRCTRVWNENAQLQKLSRFTLLYFYMKKKWSCSTDKRRFCDLGE